MTDDELKGELFTLLARLGSKYEGASHPALLVSVHVDEILALIKEAGYVTQESIAKELQSWLDNNLPLDSWVGLYIAKYEEMIK